jgi:MFS family permease
LATLIAVAFVDKLGRKPLLRAGLVGMALSLTVVAICFWFINKSSPNTTGGPTDAGLITLVALVVYIASFAFSLGPVVWTVINEIFPRSIRGRGVSIATAANWGSAWLVSQFFLSLVSTIGESGTFLLFAALSVVAFIWVSKALPETRGRSLEDIEQMWLDEPGALKVQHPQ